MAEVGLPDVNTQLWSGFFAPAGTPEPIVAKLKADLARALADVDVQQKLKEMAVKPGGPTGEEFARRIENDIKTFSEVVRAANLKFEQ
jgi:tripartite-type tricarboxylate transporter receptor subunit TctC